jgi:hypothetical protein
MKLEEFIRNRDRYRHRGAFGALAGLVLFMGPLFLLAHFEQEHETWTKGSWRALTVFGVVVMVAVWPLVWVWSSRLATRFGLRCPHCRKEVVGMSSIVIATGNCGYCGGRVLDEAPENR